MVEHAEDIPFTTFVEVPGALPVMSCTVEGSVEHITWNLFDIADGDQFEAFRLTDPYVEVSECPVFCRLAQKTVIVLTVAVAEDQQINVAAIPITTAQVVVQ